MDCQRCHKRPATVHLTQVINGEKSEIHVCEHCAKEKGYMNEKEDNFTLTDLLSGLFNHDHQFSFKGQQSKPYEKQSVQLKCPNCGLTYQQFAKIGKFGCADCYKTFDERLDPIFKRVHSGNAHHHGKIPKREAGHLHLKKQVDQLRAELRGMIEQEEFEQAAQLRDQIRSLEQQLHQEKGDGE
ncbi:UvrB/UvrC motif-containing protein [Halobacillus sp. Marseille-Q1614]|uniref:UvrB/UvrC motif-containing protein n=1 Tax=Halobacillus sp. Marseille-Q1614 TaxID=2709134 RepID=UPI00157008FB|nr:UvrB/UvrC motif-containing protein [Halobacillus sp. Marseille-Q1614]